MGSGLRAAAAIADRRAVSLYCALDKDCKEDAEYIAGGRGIQYVQQFDQEAHFEFRELSHGRLELLGSPDRTAKYLKRGHDVRSSSSYKQLPPDDSQGPSILRIPLDMISRVWRSGGRVVRVGALESGRTTECDRQDDAR